MRVVRDLLVFGGTILAVACAGSGGSSNGGGNGSGAAAGNGAGASDAGLGGSSSGGSGGSFGIGGSGATAGTGASAGAGTGGGAGTDGGGGAGGCQPASDNCPMGQYCDPSSNTCAAGCKNDSDCGSGLHCDSNHQCVACLVDTDCPSGQICANNACAAGCSATQPCASGTCCNGACSDTNTDPANCGGCGKACPTYANASATCSGGTCSMGACAAGFADCNQDPTDGCEWDTTQYGPCLCTPGATQSCYDGPAGTQGVGPCKAGTQTCDVSGVSWSPCQGEVTPIAEICANNVDDDCNGKVDDSPDADGDGWTVCDGDCCDNPNMGCSKPALVNPGAFEYVGNGVDDDCDPSTSDTTPAPDCSTAQKFTGVTGTDVAKAMDLCQFTTANPPLKNKKWGVISVQQLLANGSSPGAQLTNMQNYQSAVLTDFGTGGIVPQHGATMAGLSSGRMRDENDPGYVAPDPGTSFSSYSQPPTVYVNAHGGVLPSSQGCSGSCPSGNGANDSVDIRLTIRVPTNAQSFSFNLRYLTAEYWTWSCTDFNDFFLALLQSGASGIPADHNISFDSLGNPLSVNNGFFDTCTAKGCYTCASGAGALAGTGLEIGNTGGATSWLKTTSPVVPGETMTLDLTVFDVSDTILDSDVLLDNFQWSINPSGVGTVAQ